MTRLAFALPDDGEVAIGDGRLVVRRMLWTCRGTRLDARVIAAGEVPALPAPEPSEPVPGALARLALALRGTRALLWLANPAEALGPAIPLAEGARLVGIGSDADLACWDAAIALGMPLYGVRGTLAMDLVRPTVEGALAALAYGGFRCEEGCSPLAIDEDRRGVAWRLVAPGEVAVIVRGGFEAERHVGDAGRRDDLGGEGSVRLEIRCGAGRCWTQPRFVAGRGA